MKKIDRYEVNWINETLNSEAYFEVKRNGEILHGFPTREKADEYVNDLRHTIILKTKKIASYFSGIIRNSGDGFVVGCQSYSGSGNPPILDILDYKEKSEVDLIRAINVFAKKYRLKFERR